jgi:hypothetical protein
MLSQKDASKLIVTLFLAGITRLACAATAVSPAPAATTNAIVATTPAATGPAANTVGEDTERQVIHDAFHEYHEHYEFPNGAGISPSHSVVAINSRPEIHYH